MWHTDKKPSQVTVGTVFALLYLGLTSLGFAYAPNGFDGATVLNHVYAILTVVSGFKVMFDLG